MLNTLSAVHAIYGTILLVVAVLLTIWNLVLAAGKVKGKSYRMALIGLLDLQVLLGIVTWIVHWQGGLFILHPLVMILTVIYAHIFTKDSRGAKARALAFVITTVLLFIGWGLASL